MGLEGSPPGKGFPRVVDVKLLTVVSPHAAFGPWFALSWLSASLRSMKPWGKHDVWSQKYSSQGVFAFLLSRPPFLGPANTPHKSCHISSPCSDLVIQSLWSQRGHQPNVPAEEPALCTRESTMGLVPGTPLHPCGHGVVEPGWTSPPPLTGGGPAGGDTSPCTKPARPVPGSTGAVWELVVQVLGEEEPSLPCQDGRISQSRSG